MFPAFPKRDVSPTGDGSGAAAAVAPGPSAWIDGETKALASRALHESVACIAEAFNAPTVLHFKAQTVIHRTIPGVAALIADLGSIGDGSAAQGSVQGPLRDALLANEAVCGAAKADFAKIPRRVADLARRLRESRAAIAEAEARLDEENRVAVERIRQGLGTSPAAAPATPSPHEVDPGDLLSPPLVNNDVDVAAEVIVDDAPSESEHGSPRTDAPPAELQQRPSAGDDELVKRTDDGEANGDATATHPVSTPPASAGQDEAVEASTSDNTTAEAASSALSEPTDEAAAVQQADDAAEISAAPQPQADDGEARAAAAGGNSTKQRGNRKKGGR